MSRTTLIITLLLAIAMAGFTTGCVSPLDSDTPRVETPLTPAPKVDPISITADFDFAGNDYAFDGDPIIKLDTTVSPMRIWMQFDMTEVSTPTGALIQRFRVNLDSAAIDGFQNNLTNGEVTMWMDVGSGVEAFGSDRTTNLATILSAEQTKVDGEPHRVEITLLLTGNADGFFVGIPKEEVFGTIKLEI